MKRLLLAALAAVSACAAKAQNYPAPVVPLVGCSFAGNCSGPVSSTNPMPVSGGFLPTSVGTPIAVTTSAVTATLPSGTVVVASNVGANTAYCALGGSSSTAQQPIPAGGWFAFSVGSATQLTCLTSTGTTTVNLVGGSGLPTGGGGSGGSGGGSIPTGSAGTPNASVLTVQGVSGGTSVPVTGNFWQSTQPVSISSLPALSAGSNTIGAISNTGFAATQSGTWNVGLSAGSNTVGKADVLGAAGATLDSPAGTANSQALTIQGNSSGIAVPTSLASLPSLAAGSNTIGSINNISGAVSLPTGAATSANQPTNAAQASATSGQTGSLNMGAVSTSSPAYTSGQTDALSLTTAGALRVDATATTQPISGSVSISGTPSVSISGSPVLGAGSSTIGKADILGNSGTALDSAVGTSNAQAMTIQGNSNGIAVPTSLASLPSLAAGSATIGSIANINGTVSLPTGAATSANQPTNAAQASTTSGQTGNLHMGAVTTSSPLYTSGQTDPLSLTTAGALRVDATATTQPISGSVSISGTPSVSISGNPVLGAGSNTIGKADMLGNSGTALDSAAGTSNAQAITIQGNASGVPVPVAGTLSATVGGFTPTPAYGVETVTATSAAYALPAGTVAIFYNTGSNAVTVKLGSSSVSVVCNQGDVIQPSSWMAFTVGTATYYAAITSAGTSTIVVSGGSGLPTGAGGTPVPTGSAGSSNASVVTVQGISGGTGVPVTGAFWQATQPVSLASLPALVAGSATIGNVDQTTATAGFSKITDGTNTAAVKAASTAPAATDPAEVVTESPNSPLAPFAATSTSSLTRPSNTTTYTAGTGWNNATSSATGYFTFSSACRVNGGQVLIPQIDIWSSANPTTKLVGVVYLFDATIGTLVNDNAAFMIAPSDFANLTGNQQGLFFALLNSQASGASNSGLSLTGVNYRAQCASGTTTIYGMVEVLNAYAPASGEALHVTLHTVGAN